MAQIKVEVLMDTDQQRIVVSGSRGLTPVSTAVILTQAATQCLAKDQQERSLIITPNPNARIPGRVDA